MFNPDELAAVVKHIVPDGATKAVLGTVDNTGAQVIVGLDFNTSTGKWSVQGSFEHKWSGDNVGKVAILWSAP